MIFKTDKLNYVDFFASDKVLSPLERRIGTDSFFFFIHFHFGQGVSQGNTERSICSERKVLEFIFNGFITLSYEGLKLLKK